MTPAISSGPATRPKGMRSAKAFTTGVSGVAPAVIPVCSVNPGWTALTRTSGA